MKEKFKEAISNLENPVKKLLVNGYIELSSSEEVRMSGCDNLMHYMKTRKDSRIKIKFNDKNKKKIDNLLAIFYKNMGWPTEDMDFQKVEYNRKFELLRSIYTLIQLRQPFLSKPYLECHECGGRIRRQGDKWFLPQCDKCGMMISFDRNIINL